MTNGGYNGVLVNGVPMVCAGKTEDKADVCSRVAWCRAWIELRSDRPSDEALRKALGTVMGDGRYRRAAERVRDDCVRRNGPGESVLRGAEATERQMMTGSSQV